MSDKKPSPSKDENNENTCVICFKKVDIYSLGQCDHPVCYECSTRMRVLCRQNECPICRQELPKVVFTRKIRPYEQLINYPECQLDEKYQIQFLPEDIKSAFDNLLIHECPECFKIMANFHNLRIHVKRVHQLTYCDLCVDHLKILTSERRCYTRRELDDHRKYGDPDDRSHRGHPLCKFCETRYMDTDELYKHVRKDHLFCHFCDADGVHQYYKTYDSLRDHFRTEHFLCEEGECYFEKFTSVFRTDIDLKAHTASKHGKTLGKAGIKQARTLDIEFSLSSRPRAFIRRTNHHRGNEGHSSHHQEEDEIDMLAAAPQPPPQRQPNTDCPEEFPSLGGATSAASISRKIASLPKAKTVVTYEEFPALPPAYPPPTTTEATMCVKVNSIRPKPSSSTKLSIKVNHPSFTTTFKASKTSNEQTYNCQYPSLDLGIAFPGGGPSTSVSSQSQTESWQKVQKKSTENDMLSRSAYKSKHNNKTPPKLEDFPALAPKTPPKTPVTAPALNTAHTSNNIKQPAKNKKKKSKSKAQNNLNVPETDVTKRPDTPIPDPDEVAAKEISNKENECKQKEFKQKEKPKSKEPQQIGTFDEVFPALGNAPKAPPGFDVKWAPKKPPPGMAPPAQPAVAPPPGFSAMNGASFPPLGGENVKMGEYSPPPNFTKRNNALVDKVAKALGSDSWVEFKDISKAFRSDLIPPDDYYFHCRQTMSEETFSQLFPELLALLPDIDKQEDLWALYNADKQADKSNMKKCAICRQVLRSGDFNEHYKVHSLSTRYASFTMKKPRSGHNAWAKPN